MNRCALTRRQTLAASLAVLGVALAGPARAQLGRRFPRTALRGELAFGEFPQVSLNGTATRLTPGTKVRAENGMLVMHGHVVGQKYVVNYTLDSMGMVHDVWILGPAEIAMRPWPRSTEEAQAWQFDEAAQTWTKP